MDDWTAQLDYSRQVDVIYTHFAKAFDTVLHRRLLFKLKTYNINMELLTLITDFLCSTRKQYVVLNGEQGFKFRVSESCRSATVVNSPGVMFAFVCRCDVGK